MATRATSSIVVCGSKKSEVMVKSQKTKTERDRERERDREKYYNKSGGVMNEAPFVF